VRLVLHASAEGRTLYEQLGFEPTNGMRFAGELPERAEVVASWAGMSRDLEANGLEVPRVFPTGSQTPSEPEPHS
jgi:hypothetical protein